MTDSDPLTEAVKAGADALEARWSLEGLRNESDAEFDAECVLTAALEADEIVLPWVCEDCGFAFDADHTNVDGGGHSCPACAEHSLTLLVERLRAELAERTEQRDQAVRLLDAISKPLIGIEDTNCNALDLLREPWVKGILQPDNEAVETDQQEASKPTGVVAQLLADEAAFATREAWFQKQQCILHGCVSHSDDGCCVRCGGRVNYGRGSSWLATAESDAERKGAQLQPEDGETDAE